jgi:hypothetical protein
MKKNWFLSLCILLLSGHVLLFAEALENRTSESTKSHLVATATDEAVYVQAPVNAGGKVYTGEGESLFEKEEEDDESSSLKKRFGPGGNMPLAVLIYSSNSFQEGNKAVTADVLSTRHAASRHILFQVFRI